MVSWITIWMTYWFCHCGLNDQKCGLFYHLGRRKKYQL